MPARGQGPEPGPPGPAFLPGPLSGFKMRGLQSAPAGLSSRDQGTPGWRHGQAANLSTPCPSNHLQAQVTAEPRAKCGCAPLPDLQPRLPTPDPGERPPVSARTDGAAPLVPETPGPATRHLAQVGGGGGTSPRLRGTGSTLRPTHRLRGGSLPTPSPPSPCSHLGASLVGPEAGAETPGRPPAGLVHDLPGVERAPPECGLRPPHGVNAPQSRLLEGERGGVRDGGEGNGDVARLRTAAGSREALRRRLCS